MTLIAAYEPPRACEFAVGGIVAIAAGFLGEAGLWLMMAVLTGAALIPVVYSYLLWRRLGRPAPTP